MAKRLGTVLSRLVGAYTALVSFDCDTHGAISRRGNQRLFTAHWSRVIYTNRIWFSHFHYPALGAWARARSPNINPKPIFPSSLPLIPIPQTLLFLRALFSPLLLVQTFLTAPEDLYLSVQKNVCYFIPASRRPASRAFLTRCGFILARTLRFQQEIEQLSSWIHSDSELKRCTTY